MRVSVWFGAAARGRSAATHLDHGPLELAGLGTGRAPAMVGFLELALSLGHDLRPFVAGAYRQPLAGVRGWLNRLPKAGSGRSCANLPRPPAVTPEDGEPAIVSTPARSANEHRAENSRCTGTAKMMARSICPVSQPVYWTDTGTRRSPATLFDRDGCTRRADACSCGHVPEPILREQNRPGSFRSPSVSPVICQYAPVVELTGLPGPCAC